MREWRIFFGEYFCLIFYLENRNISHRRVLAAVAPVLEVGASGDACSNHPNWAAIVASLGKLTLRFPDGWERSEPSGERRPSRPKVAASPRHRIVGICLRASPGRGADEAQSGLVVVKAT